MFRFSIRDLLWLTLVIAVAVCLIRNYNTLEKERAAWLAEKDALIKQHDADLANERRIANLRAMEVAGRIVSPRESKPSPTVRSEGPHRQRLNSRNGQKTGLPRPSGRRTNVLRNR